MTEISFRESQNALMWDDDHGQKHWNQSIAVFFKKRYVTKVSEILANADVTFMLWMILYSFVKRKEVKTHLDKTQCFNTIWNIHIPLGTFHRKQYIRFKT